MSDLSQPHTTLQSSGERGFAWPTPDLAGYPAPVAAAQPLACEVEGVNRRKMAGRLVAFDPAQGLVRLSVHKTGKPLPLRLDQFRRLRLVEPLAAVEAPADARDLAAEVPQLPFRVEFCDGSIWEGQTIGMREEGYGLFLFEPLDDRGTVQRWFVPRTAYASRDRHADRRGAGRAASRQHPSRSPKPIGQQEAMRSAEARRHAAYCARSSRRSSWPRRSSAGTDADGPDRRGAHLARQRHPSAARRRAGPAAARPQRAAGRTAGARGSVSRDDLQTALARKMGYPLVDLQAFPADAEAVCASCPIRWRRGSARHAADGPRRPPGGGGRRPVAAASALDEVEFKPQCKVVPVLARSGILIGRACDRAYEKVGSVMIGSTAAGPTTRQPVEFELGDASRLLATLEKAGAERDGSTTKSSRRSSRATTSWCGWSTTMIIEAHNQGVSDIHIEMLPRAARRSGSASARTARCALPRAAGDLPQRDRRAAQDHVRPRHLRAPQAAGRQDQVREVRPGRSRSSCGWRRFRPRAASRTS